MRHDHAQGHAGGQAARAVAEVDVRNAYDGSEYASLESVLRGLPGVLGVHLDRTRGVAHLTYDPAVTTPDSVFSRGAGSTPSLPTCATA